MKNNLTRTALAAMLLVSLQTRVSAQEDAPKEKDGKHEEIIIKKKGDKDVKLTLEINDSAVLINGKPIGEFTDDNISIRLTDMLPGFDGDNFSFVSPPPPASPFRGAWSYKDDGLKYLRVTNTPFLGVNSEKAEKGGARITSVLKSTAAEKSGLQKGDIITKIDDYIVSNPEELSQAVHKYKPEDKVTITYLRDGKEQKLTATLGRNKGIYSESFNMTLPQLAEIDRLNESGELRRLYVPRAISVNGRPRIGIKAQDTEDGKGVKVLDVDDESPADKAGIKEGDIITEFDGKPVNSADGLAELSRAAREKFSFKVKLKRNEKSEEVEVKIPRKLKTADL